MNFKTEKERLDYARKLAEEKLAELEKKHPGIEERLGYGQIISDLEHQILLSLPKAKKRN